MHHRDPWSRRRFLGHAGVVGAGVATGHDAARADLGRARTISIFHTTDLHGRILPTSTYEGLDDVGGLARCVTCIRQWRREAPHSLTVDIGDLVQGTAVSLRRGGTLMVDILNRLGYDAWALGNHDFDWGPEKLEACLARSTPPVLTANLAGSGPAAADGGWRSVRPWLIREVGGFRIALVGLITPGLPWWLTDETLGGTTVADPVESLGRSLREVRSQKPDAIVVLGHMGWRFADDFANPVRSILKEVRGVDVFIAGHTHQHRPTWFLNGVLCSQASYYGIHCGRIDLTFDMDSRALVDRRAFTLLMDDRFALDPLVLELARQDLEAADADLERPVATVQRKIPGAGRGSGLVNLLCACFAGALQRVGTRVDAVFHGTFGTGDLAPGRLTVGDCWRIIPYENLLVTGRIRVADLVAILAEDRGLKDSDRTLWPLEVRLSADGQPQAIVADGEALPPDRLLTLACNSYDAQSGGKKLLRLREALAGPDAARQTTAIDTRSALIEGLLDKAVVG